MAEGKKTWVEEVEISGNHLVERIKELVAEGNARRVILKNKEGQELFDLPLTVGVVGGGIITLALPVLAAIGAVAALLTQVKLEIVREVEESKKPEEPVSRA